MATGGMWEGCEEGEGMRRTDCWKRLGGWVWGVRVVRAGWRGRAWLGWVWAFACRGESRPPAKKSCCRRAGGALRQGGQPARGV